MTALKLTIMGHAPLKNGGSAVAVTLVTANDDGRGIPETKTVVVLMYSPAALVAVKV
jgi:hypothetical protein